MGYFPSPLTQVVNSKEGHFCEESNKSIDAGGIFQSEEKIVEILDLNCLNLLDV